MARQTNINVNVNSTSAVKSINVLKKAFIDLNSTIRQTTNNGNIKLKIDLGGIDLNTLNAITLGIKKLSKSLDKLSNSADRYKQNGQVLSITNNTIIRSNERVANSSRQVAKGFIESAIVLETWRRNLSSLIDDYSKLTGASFSVGIADQMDISSIQKLNVSFMQLSSTVPHTASNLAEAVSDLIRTGRSFEESRQIIEQVAKLSTASGDSLKSTAQVVTKVMTALDVSADKTIDTLNSMHSTAIRTASDMGYLAESFKNIAGAASVLVKSSGLSGEALSNYKQDVLDLSMALSGSMANLGLSASYQKQ